MTGAVDDCFFAVQAYAGGNPMLRLAAFQGSGPPFGLNLSPINLGTTVTSGIDTSAQWSMTSPSWGRVQAAFNATQSQVCAGAGASTGVEVATPLTAQVKPPQNR